MPFKTGFHIVVGLLMALLAWLANALIVLPWIGEGIARSLYLSADGMIYFAAAHTVFFVLLALLYARFSRQKRRRAPMLLTPRPDWQPLSLHSLRQTQGRSRDGTPHSRTTQCSMRKMPVLGTERKRGHYGRMQTLSSAGGHGARR